MNFPVMGLAALLMAFSLQGVAAANRDQIPMTAPQRQSLGIEVASPRPVTTFFGQPLPAQVVIPPTQLRQVSAPQAGLVSRLLVATGDTVKKGQLLAQLQSPELAGLEREYLQALTQLRLATSEWQRDMTLYAEGIIAKRRYLETKSRREELLAALDENRQSLLLAGLSSEDVENLRRTRQLSTTLPVRSPIDGVVLERQVNTGERVESSAPLFRIGNLVPLWLEVRAPIEQASGLQEGDVFRVSGVPAEGRLVAIGKAVDPASQTVLLRAEVTQGADLLKPGQYVQVSIGKAPAAQQRYRVPSGAIARRGELTVVFVQTPNGFRAQPVKVIESAEGETVVSGALSPDEPIAVKGIAAIKGAWIGLGGSD